MGKSCRIYKTCCVCQRERHNLEFNSNEKGRTDIKPFCRHCKPIYMGIKQGLISEEIYIGLDYDITQLKVDNYGFLLFLKDKSIERITLDLAERLVQQGAAHVLSPTTIESLLEENIPRSTNIQDSYEGEMLPSLKSYIHSRDEENCHYCNRKGNTIDHIIPKFHGGLNVPLNLVCCCEECNKLKSNMSKDKFISHLKKGDYDYFLHAWKSHVKINSANKICHTCGEVKEWKEYEKQHISCKKCEIFQNSFNLGILSLSNLKKIVLDKSLIKDDTIKVIGIDGEELGFIKREKAFKLLKIGIFSTPSENTIQFVFSDKQIKRLYPRFSLETLKKEVTVLKVKTIAKEIPEKKENNEKKTNTKEEKVIDSEIIDVYTIHNEYIAKVPKSVGKNLCKENMANLYGRNKIRLLRGAKETIDQYPQMREYIFYKISGVTVLNEWEIEVDNGDKISLKEATEILCSKKGKLTSLNRIKLNESEEKQKASS